MRLPVFALMLCVFCVGTAEIAIMGILPNVAEDLSVSIPSAGLLITGYAVGVAVGGPLVTLLTLRIPRDRLLCGLMVVFLAGNTASCFATGYETLLVARVLTSLAHGTFVAMAGLVAAQTGPPDRRATAIAQVSLGFNLANILGSPLGTVIGQAWGWRATFAAISAAALLSLLLVMATLPERRAPEERPVTGGSMRAELRVLSHPVVVLSVAVTVLAQGAVFTASTYLAPLLTGVSRFAPWSVGVLLVVFGIGAVLGNLAGGRLADRDPARGAWLVLAALLGTLVLFWLLAPVRPLSPLGLVLFGAAGFSIIPVLQARMLALAAAAPLLALTVNVSAFNLGNGLGAWLGGAVIDEGWGTRATILAAAATAAAALLLLACAPRARTPADLREDHDAVHRR